MEGGGSVGGFPARGTIVFAKRAEGATAFLGLFVRGARASLGGLPAFCFLSAFAFSGVISRFPAFSFSTVSSLVDFSFTEGVISSLACCSLALCSSSFFS